MDNGGLGDIWGNLALLIPIIILILFSIFLRRRRGGRTRLEVVTTLLAEINYNQKLMEAFISRWQVKKFKTGSWDRNKNGLDFLDQSLQIALSDAFSKAEDFNLEIDTAKKHKSSSYLAGIQVDKLREPLAKGKQGLQQWLQANLQTEMPQRRRGLFG